MADAEVPPAGSRRRAGRPFLEGLFDPFYRGGFDAGLQVRIVHQAQVAGDSARVELADPAGFARQHPLLVVPGLYLAGDDILAWLRTYATSGGHLVLGPRTGYADEEGRAGEEPMPAALADLAGVHYDESSNISGEISVIGTERAGFALGPRRRQPVGWMASRRELRIGRRIRTPALRSLAAVTTREHGSGRVTCVGTVPNPAFARDLRAWLAKDRWSRSHGLPETVTMTGATSRDGRHVRFLHNWSWQPARVALDWDGADVLSEVKHRAGEEVVLGPWDVRVFVE